MCLTSTVCIIVNRKLKHQEQKAAALSEKLSLHLCCRNDSEHKYHLVYTDNRLELQYNPHQHKYKHGSVFVDFLGENNTILKRVLTTTIKTPLARASGIKSGFRPTIVDTTAGLGIDGFTLAWLGCKVILIERSNLVHALLEDGLMRARQNEELKEIIKNRIILKKGDAKIVLPTLSEKIDTVILDPMYPPRNKSSLNKKEMRLLRDVVGDDTDSSDLFSVSSVFARNRVVVKRPKGAREIVDAPQPSHRIVMKSGRFDVYHKTIQGVST